MVNNLNMVDTLRGGAYIEWYAEGGGGIFYFYLFLFHFCMQP